MFRHSTFVYKSQLSYDRVILVNLAEDVSECRRILCFLINAHIARITGRHFFANRAFIIRRRTYSIYTIVHCIVYDPG
jgi:hypothetical protein